MKRILFVDDDPSVLASLENRLYKFRRQWEMSFASGGEAALAELERAEVDVIVSDMRMPGMDGTELLRRVRQQYPTVARIILSGHVENDGILPTLEVAHQFLSKPVEGEVLQAAIARACELQSLLADEKLRGVVGRLDRLPSIPAVYWELSQCVCQSDCSTADLAHIVEQDPAICAKILQIVNSAYFGLPHAMTSVQQATTYLGVELLKALVLTAHVFAPLAVSPVEGVSPDMVQRRSLLTARLAKALLPDPKLAEGAFTAGMLHDLGTLILVLGMPEAYARVLETARTTGVMQHLVEKEQLQVTHAEVGAYLLGIWGLPLRIVEAVALHHTPSRIADGPFEVLAALHVAATTADAGEVVASGRSWLDTLDLSFLERAGFLAQLPRWREIIKAELQRLQQVA